MMSDNQSKEDTRPWNQRHKLVANDTDSVIDNIIGAGEMSEIKEIPSVMRKNQLEVKPNGKTGW